MSGWMKVVLGVLLSLGIGGGVAAFVNDLHPMRRHYDASAERCAAEDPSRDEQRIDCFDDYRRVTDASDRQDRWVALAAGAGAVALFWVLAYLLYFRPRRRRAQQAPSM